MIAGRTGLCVIVRKSYGAGLYAMAGPAFDPEATIALPSAMIAVMKDWPQGNCTLLGGSILQDRSFMLYQKKNP